MAAIFKFKMATIFFDKVANILNRTTLFLRGRDAHTRGSEYSERLKAERKDSEAVQGLKMKKEYQEKGRKAPNT